MSQQWGIQLKIAGLLVPEPFIGLNCNIKATKLNETGITTTIQDKFSFFYIYPPTKNAFILMLTICLQINDKDFNMIFFGQHEKQNGDISLFPISARQAIQIHFRSSSKCFMLQNLIPTFDLKRIDGQQPKIVFGMMRTDRNQTNSNPENITLYYQINKPINTNLFQYIFFAMLATLIPCLFIGIYQCIKRKRMMQKRNKRKPAQINEMMPIKKYKQYSKVRNKDQNQQEKHYCSICLCEYEQKSDVRITPCSHVFHQDCLDSWLQAHTTCPVCRFTVVQQDNLDLNLSQTRARNGIRLTLF